jgi:hypothetical protein
MGAADLPHLILLIYMEIPGYAPRTPDVKDMRLHEAVPRLRNPKIGQMPSYCTASAPAVGGILYLQSSSVASYLAPPQFLYRAEIAHSNTLGSANRRSSRDRDRAAASSATTTASYCPALSTNEQRSASISAAASRLLSSTNTLRVPSSALAARFSMVFAGVNGSSSRSSRSFLELPMTSFLLFHHESRSFSKYPSAPCHTSLCSPVDTCDQFFGFDALSLPNSIAA